MRIPVGIMIFVLGISVFGVRPGLEAAEPDELRPGMSEDAVFNVFTMYQSCKNTPLESGADNLAWSGIFDGEDGRVLVRFEHSLVQEIRYRFEAAPEAVEAVFRRLLDRLKVRYGHPLQQEENRIVWSAPAFTVSAMLQREVGMIHVLLASRTATE